MLTAIGDPTLVDAGHYASLFHHLAAGVRFDGFHLKAIYCNI